MTNNEQGKGSARPDATYPVSLKGENSRMLKDPEGWQLCKLRSELRGREKEENMRAEPK